MSREHSLLPNRKHTVASLTEELESARRSGRAQEIADLSLLIQNAQRPKGAPCLPGTAQARNRQGARRHNREKLPPGKDYNQNTERRLPKVTDWIETIAGDRWQVTRVTADLVWHDVPGEPLTSCPFKYCRIVDGPRKPGEQSPPNDPCALCRAGETLYHAIWDVIDTMIAGSERDALEQAARTYEETLQAASTP